MTQADAQTNDVAAENGAGAAIAPSGEALKNVLESLIFVSNEPVTAKRLARAARSTIQFRSGRESADFVKTLVAPKPIRLTRAQLETLAIIAYRQPITRPEVDDVRGVDSGLGEGGKGRCNPKKETV